MKFDPEKIDRGLYYINADLTARSIYQKIQLIKPAIVSIEPNTNPQTWRLQQQGELVFL